MVANKPDHLNEVDSLGHNPTDLSMLAPLPQKIFVDNTYRRSLALLMGMSINGVEILAATSDKVLKVAPVGSGYEQYKSYPTDGTLATAADSFNSTNIVNVATKASQWSILVQTNDAVIEFIDPQDVSYGHDIVLPIGYYTFDFISSECRIRNFTAGSNATFQIVAYY